MVIDFTKHRTDKLIKRGLELEKIMAAEIAEPEHYQELHNCMIKLIKIWFSTMPEDFVLDTLNGVATYAQVYEAMGEEIANKYDNYTRLKNA